MPRSILELLAGKVTRLETILLDHSPLLIAFSGGVDSSYLLAAARQVLGNKVTGVIADSASLPRLALAKAQKLAMDLGAQLQTIPTGELDREEYAINPMNRCYFCKAELFRRMDDYAKTGGFKFLAYGENLDDVGHIRPGAQAAAEFSVIAPLKMAGLGKAEIRELSREMNLPTAEDAAQPCLSSRIPYGIRVTRDALEMIEQAEEYVRSLGFKIFRVRHLSSIAARIQIEPTEMPHLKDLRNSILGGVRAVGYISVEIDPLGYQSPA